jgi:hypothetical protein
MAKQTFTTGQVLTAAQMTSLQQTAMGGGSPSTKTASYVLVAADAGTVIQMNSASATTITVNTALFAAGDSVQIQNIGAGVCTVTAGTATVTTAGSLDLSQWENGFLYFTSTSASIFFDVVQSPTVIPTSYGYSAGKNSVINGGFDTWQRGTSLAISNGVTTYLADRWAAYRAATGSTVSRQATSDTTNLPTIQYCARVQRDNANASTSAISYYNMFESINSIPFAGQTVIFSFYARKGANYSQASSGLTVVLKTGTGTDQNIYSGFTGATNAVLQTATLTTTWQRFTYSATLASSITQIALGLEFAPVGTAGAADYFEVTGAQLELGTSATTFSRNASTYQGELAACQRYYYRLTGGNPSMLAMTGLGYSTTTILGYVNFPTTMRTAPSALDTSAMASFAWDRGNTGSGNTPSSVIADSTWNANIGAFQINTTGITANSIYRIFSNAASAYVGFTSEL